MFMFPLPNHLLVETATDYGPPHHCYNGNTISVKKASLYWDGAWPRQDQMIRIFQCLFLHIIDQCASGRRWLTSNHVTSSFLCISLALYLRSGRVSLMDQKCVVYLYLVCWRHQCHAILQVSMRSSLRLNFIVIFMERCGCTVPIKTVDTAWSFWLTQHNIFHCIMWSTINHFHLCF